MGCHLCHSCRYARGLSHELLIGVVQAGMLGMASARALTARAAIEHAVETVVAFDVLGFAFLQHVVENCKARYCR